MILCYIYMLHTIIYSDMQIPKQVKLLFFTYLLNIYLYNVLFLYSLCRNNLFYLFVWAIGPNNHFINNKYTIRQWYTNGVRYSKRNTFEPLVDKEIKKKYKELERESVNVQRVINPIKLFLKIKWLKVSWI